MIQPVIVMEASVDSPPEKMQEKFMIASRFKKFANFFFHRSFSIYGK